MENIGEAMQKILERRWIAEGKKGTFQDFVKERAGMTEKERVEKLAEMANGKRGDLDLVDGYNCPKCLNRGYSIIATEHNGQYSQACVPCSCSKVRRAIRRMKRSGLENSLKKLKDFEVTEAWQKSMVDTAAAYINADHSNGASLMLCGAVGSGKAFIGTAVCRELLHEGYEVIYMPWVNEAQRLKAMANDEGLADEMRIYQNADFLYIDDLFKPLPGQTSPTPADFRLAYDIINYRYINKKPMIISCEKFIEELLQYDEATVSRIYEMCKGFTVCIGRKPGRNYRIKDMTEII